MKPRCLENDFEEEYEYVGSEEMAYTEEDTEILHQKVIKDIDNFIIEMRHFDSYDPEKMYKDEITNKILELKNRINKRFGVE